MNIGFRGTGENLSIFSNSIRSFTDESSNTDLTLHTSMRIYVYIAQNCVSYSKAINNFANSVIENNFPCSVARKSSFTKYKKRENLSILKVSSAKKSVCKRFLIHKYRKTQFYSTIICTTNVSSSPSSKSFPKQRSKSPANLKKSQIKDKILPPPLCQ